MDLNEEFYSDALEVLTSTKQSLGECSIGLSKTTLDNYKDNFKTFGNAFGVIITIIDKFIENWKEDDYKICSTLKSIRNYLEYYVRLCESSIENNYNMNRAYMIESINTVSLAIGFKLNFLKKEMNGKY